MIWLQKTPTYLQNTAEVRVNGHTRPAEQYVAKGHLWTLQGTAIAATPDADDSR
jgi:hypothetical protein